eukprot:TRINITY_DN9626_c0_g1_i1.p1 TRINITY_DN9626_c0_g1~~TRINITY_DN9626_c0_g1_i1.p1  ORF type:complete len:939 (+),score=190.27 TRINITY_DN9626_c0_g1_i1:60-2876(+)
MPRQLGVRCSVVASSAGPSKLRGLGSSKKLRGSEALPPLAARPAGPSETDDSIDQYTQPSQANDDALVEEASSPKNVLPAAGTVSFQEWVLQGTKDAVKCLTPKQSPRIVVRPLATPVRAIAPAHREVAGPLGGPPAGSRSHWRRDSDGAAAFQERPRAVVAEERRTPSIEEARRRAALEQAHERAVEEVRRKAAAEKKQQFAADVERVTASKAARRHAEEVKEARRRVAVQAAPVFGCEIEQAKAPQDARKHTNLIIQSNLRGDESVATCALTATATGAAGTAVAVTLVNEEERVPALATMEATKKEVLGATSAAELVQRNDVTMAVVRSEAAVGSSCKPRSNDVVGSGKEDHAEVKGASAAESEKAKPAKVTKTTTAIEAAGKGKQQQAENDGEQAQKRPSSGVNNQTESVQLVLGGGGAARTNADGDVGLRSEQQRADPSHSGTIVGVPLSTDVTSDWTATPPLTNVSMARWFADITSLKAKQEAQADAAKRAWEDALKRTREVEKHWVGAFETMKARFSDAAGGEGLQCESSIVATQCVASPRDVGVPDETKHDASVEGNSEGGHDLTQDCSSGKKQEAELVTTCHDVVAAPSSVVLQTEPIVPSVSVPPLSATVPALAMPVVAQATLTSPVPPMSTTMVVAAKALVSEPTHRIGITATPCATIRMAAPAISPAPPACAATFPSMQVAAAVATASAGQLPAGAPNRPQASLPELTPTPATPLVPKAAREPRDSSYAARAVEQPQTLAPIPPQTPSSELTPTPATPVVAKAILAEPKHSVANVVTPAAAGQMAVLSSSVATSAPIANAVMEPARPKRSRNHAWVSPQRTLTLTPPPPTRSASSGTLLAPKAARILMAPVAKRARFGVTSVVSGGGGGGTCVPAQGISIAAISSAASRGGGGARAGAAVAAVDICRGPSTAPAHKLLKNVFSTHGR